MTFGSSGSGGSGGELARAVAEFEAAVAARDAERTGGAFDAIRQGFGAGGPRRCGSAVLVRPRC
ncbi:hypothetical protein [Streptomyces sp. NPDC051561]|uniref:hypothetical protein n=1 Tax=Streptomyces sp. NPDC051561 TaxID=3365658 RepID=UPI0037B17205